MENGKTTPETGQQAVSKPEDRRRYETLRLAQWAIVDAITAAGHIAARAVDCFDGTEDSQLFERIRVAIGKLAAGTEMREIKSAVHSARSKL